MFTASRKSECQYVTRQLHFLAVTSISWYVYGNPQIRMPSCHGTMTFPTSKCQYRDVTMQLPRSACQHVIGQCHIRYRTVNTMVCVRQSPNPHANMSYECGISHIECQYHIMFTAIPKSACQPVIRQWHSNIEWEYHCMFTAIPKSACQPVIGNDNSEIALSISWYVYGIPPNSQQGNGTSDLEMSTSWYV